MRLCAGSLRCVPTILLLWAPFAWSAEPVAPEPGASPAASRQAWFGDLHLHTSYSFDAFLMGTTSVDPETAYRFARGETVTYLGKPARRREPLDFLSVTDHAENLGVFSELEDPASEVARSPEGRQLGDLLREISRADGSRDYLSNLSMPAGAAGRLDAIERDYHMGRTNRLPAPLRDISPRSWAHAIELANRYNEPGRFTTFIGYEWTATPNASNLHRNVIFRGDDAPLPFTSYDSRLPEDLWDWLDRQRALGVEAIAIPHNGNASNGLMYDWLDSTSMPFDRAYAEQRQRNEPLSEISQHKGASETHPLLSPDDEFAGFEIYDFMAEGRRYAGHVAGSYVRDALGRGLVLQRRAGANPYKFGFVGASDLHSGLSVGTQADYAGIRNLTNLGGGKVDAATARIVLGVDAPARARLLKTTSGNLTGVWAEANTRASIYDAFRRRETFATSGPRLKLRFFAGWSLPEDLLDRGDWLTVAYGLGVPMGGDLPQVARPPSSPVFIVWAIKDPQGADLDRVQIIKVWDDGGTQRERVFDVVRADAGSAELSATWRDAGFDPRRPAAYYVRVLEVPTPRWSTLLAKEYGLPLPDGVPELVQQRGWASPIWYSPPE